MYTYTYYTLWYDLILFESVRCDSKLDMIWHDTIWCEKIGHALVGRKRQLLYHKGITNNSHWMIWILWRETLKEQLYLLFANCIILLHWWVAGRILAAVCPRNGGELQEHPAGDVHQLHVRCDLTWFDTWDDSSHILLAFFGKLHWNFIVQSWVYCRYV